MLNKTVTLLLTIATGGCAGWHLFPKETATRSGHEQARSVREDVPPSAVSNSTAFQRPADAHAAYRQAIISRVKKYWKPPRQAALKVSCQVRIEQFPDGEVISAAVLDTCGSPEVDGSIIDAVYRAAPLPRPKDPSLFERRFEFVFSTNP